MGVLELTALPSLDAERWVPLVRETDVLLVEGGDAAYLCHWMRAVRPRRPPAVAGRDGLGGRERRKHGDDPSDRRGLRRRGHSPAGDRTLGVVDFSIFPHLDNPDLPWNTMATAEQWAAGLSGPAYAIDDETAIKVVDGTVEVVSEGNWQLIRS